MKPHHAPRLVALIVALAPVATATAQQPADCTAALAAKGDKSTYQNPCQVVAIKAVDASPVIKAAYDRVLKTDGPPMSAVFSQRDLQSTAAQKPSLAGTPAQGQAIPSLQPAGVASGTVAMIGTDAGDDALAALGLNPAILFLSDAVTEEMTKWSRFADVTMFIPVTQGDQPATDAKLRYLGVRARFNVGGLKAGDKVWNAADARLKEFFAAQGGALNEIVRLLAEAKNTQACAEALLDGTQGMKLTDACGQSFSFSFGVDKADELRKSLSTVRRAADANYWGLDLRFDMGDPTLGATPDAAGHFYFGGFAWGHRWSSKTASFGLQLRTGARFAKLETVLDPEWAGEGGLGFEITRPIDDQELSVTAGIEGRSGNAPSNATDQFQSNFAMIRGSFLLPMTAANSISLNLGVPVVGDVSPIFSVNFNWGLLMSGVSGNRR